MTILKSFEKPLTPEEEIYYLSLLKNENNQEAKEVLIERNMRLVAHIAKKYNTKKVVLFGSRARGTNHPKSDIDLAIYGCEDFGDLSDCLNEELWSLLKLDIINMDDKHISPVLVTEIERDGRVLYEKV